MGIDRNILSEFIKVTNDKKETKQAQLYGTVVTKGNSKCVKIDGSEIITPVRSTTDIKDDERVMVTIKDHMATITGNMSNPSVGNDRVELAEGKIDRFDHLFAGNITAENIAANSITSDKILAGSITTDKLMAECIISDKIAADTIESRHIKADAIESGHIKAGSIEAEHIKAGIIESDHISSGTITADKIATGTITAGSGVIADGAIGNAQISKIDAAKIEAGTIDTSKVTVQGSNGHLRLKDNRLQVFDGIGNKAKERVSVGDVNGDGSQFGLRVRGADGETILLDEHGVTREGITDGSITNDKISSDANIDGAKLNINSVISKINEDGTETIQGAKIEVDGTTLETKLYDIKMKQDENTDSISQAQSQITANTNAIKLKVDEQTYTNDKKDMTSKLEKNTSEISAMKGQIALKVEHTDIENAINNVQIGGRNLATISNIKSYSGGRLVNTNYYSVEGTRINAKNQSLNNHLIGFKIHTDGIIAYTISGTTDLKTVMVYFRCHDSNDDIIQEQKFKTTTVIDDKFTLTFNDIPDNTHYFNIGVGNTNLSNYYIDKLKIEKGNKPTDWTPAPEDVTSEIETKINTAKSEIKVTTDAISQNVSNLSQTVSNKADGSTVTSINNKVGSLETSINGISGKVTNLETTTTNLGTSVEGVQGEISTLKSDVASLEVTTDGISQKVSNVESTTATLTNKVTTAQNTANTANSTANTNKSNITNLQGEVRTVKNNVASLEVTTSGISQKVSSVESTTASLTNQVGTANNNATNALNKANSANTLADSKAKVFTTTPTVPYKVGDLWVQGTSGDVMRCKTARSSGSYSASDWEKASKYTDDTKANAVDGKLTTLKGEYNTTKSQVAEINTNLDSITQRVSSTETTTATLTNKVNTAQSTADSANANASSAISKADSANNKIDGLQVGGRNLLKNSKSIYLTGSDFSAVSKRENGKITVLTSGVFNAYTWVQNNLSTTLSDLTPTTGKKFSMSVDIKTTNLKHDNIQVTFDFRGSGKTMSIGRVNLDKSKNGIWYRLSATFTTVDTKYPSCLLCITCNENNADYSGLIIEYKNWKIEEGNKATDWTPAPEDVDSSIASVDSKVQTTNNKVASIETNLGSITSRVSNVENTTTTINGNISNLQSRMNSAEQKITDSAITNVVKKSFYTKTDIDGKGYQTESQVQQTVDKVQFKFEESGGYNRLYNSAFKNGSNNWSHLSWNNNGGSGGSSFLEIRQIGDEWTLTNRNSISAVAHQLTTHTGQRLGVGFDSHKIWGGRDWTFSCLLACHRANNVTIEIVEHDNDGNRILAQGWTFTGVKTGGQNRNNWTKVHKQFSLQGNGTAWFIVRVFMGDWNGEMNTAYLWMAEPLLVLGHKDDLPYTPNADELYTDITAIDKDGIKVTHSDGTYSKMGKDGFEWFNGQTGNKYHCLMYGGEYECSSQETRTVTLPSEFRGKPFKVISTIKRIRTMADIYVHQWPILTFHAITENINHANGTFNVYASVRALNYTKTNEGTWGALVGDGSQNSAAEDASDKGHIKTTVAFWAFV